MLYGVLMKYENMAFIINDLQRKKCVIVNVKVLGSGSICCSILSARTLLCLMGTTGGACDNICVIVV